MRKHINSRTMKLYTKKNHFCRTMNYILCTMGAIVVSLASATEVEVIGRSKLGTSADRALALSNALDNAISQKKDEKCFVKKFQILSSDISQDGGYEVRIKADVEVLDKEGSEEEALRNMAREFGAPRVAIKVTEEIEGIKGGTIVQDWMGNELSACGLSVVNPDKKTDNKLIRRTELLKRPLEATIRREGIVSYCDYLIEGTLKGTVGKTQSFYGSQPMLKISLGLDTKLTDATTGNTLLAENYPMEEVIIKDPGDEGLAIREAVRLFMSSKHDKKHYGWQLIHHMFAHWMIEKQKGAIYCIEFIKMELGELQELKKKLLQTPTISNIWVRSVDAAAITIVECETKLSSDELAATISPNIPDFTLDRSENRFLSFRQGDIVTPIPENRVFGWNWIPWSSVAGTVIAAIIIAAPKNSYRLICVMLPFCKRRLKEYQKKSKSQQKNELQQKQMTNEQKQHEN